MQINALNIISIMGGTFCFAVILNNCLIPLFYKYLIYPKLAKQYKEEFINCLKSFPWLNQIQIQLKTYGEPFINLINNSKQYLYQGRELEIDENLSCFLMEQDIKYNEITQLFHFFNKLQEKIKANYLYVKFTYDKNKLKIHISGERGEYTSKEIILEKQ